MLLDLKDLKKCYWISKISRNTHQQDTFNLPFATRQMNSSEHGGRLDQHASKLCHKGKQFLYDSSLKGRW